MTIIHAFDDMCAPATPASPRLSGATIASLRTLVTRQAARLAASIQHRRTIARFSHFSAHRLHDIGFERDWDGSIIPRRHPATDVSSCEGETR